MFETVYLHARTASDGHLRLDLPLDLPIGSEVTVTVSTLGPPDFDRAEWEAHVDRIAGSIPNLERPEQWPIREVESLDDNADWQAHIDAVVGSFPEIERPVQPPLRAVESL